MRSRPFQSTNPSGDRARAVVLALCGSLPCTAAVAADTATHARWQTVAYSEDEEWASAPTSMTITTSDGAGVVISVDGQMRSKKTGHSDLVRWAVTLADCRSESGKLTTSDMTGKFVVPFPYVKGGSTFEAITAQTICNWYFNANK